MLTASTWILLLSRCGIADKVPLTGEEQGCCLGTRSLVIIPPVEGVIGAISQLHYCPVLVGSAQLCSCPSTYKHPLGRQQGEQQTKHPYTEITSLRCHRGQWVLVSGKGQGGCQSAIQPQGDSFCPHLQDGKNQSSERLLRSHSDGYGRKNLHVFLTIKAGDRECSRLVFPTQLVWCWH